MVDQDRVMPPGPWQGFFPGDWVRPRSNPGTWMPLLDGNFSISWGRRPIDRHTTALAERPWCIPFAMEIEQNQGARAR